MSDTKIKEPIKVLVIDDSIFIRKILADILDQDPQITVLDTAENGREGLEKILALKPDVVTMDVQMPVMDGLQTLEQIMLKRPTPVIILSSITTEGANETLQAFDLGAFDVVVKPKSVLQNYKEFSKDITDKVKAASKTDFLNFRNKNKISQKADILPRKQAVSSVKKTNAVPNFSTSLVVIGVSTGGPPALQTVLPQLPADLPAPIIVVQHIPTGFTGPLAQRLNDKCNLHVKEAAEGEILQAGTVYVAPAGYQTRVVHRLGKLGVNITKQVATNPRYWPSVDYTLASLAEAKVKGVLSVIMTGMGNDGLEGVKLIKELQGFTIAQSEDSCVVYGMPRAVVEADLADRIVSLDDIAGSIIECVQRRRL